MQEQASHSNALSVRTVRIEDGLLCALLLVLPSLAVPKAVLLALLVAQVLFFRRRLLQQSLRAPDAIEWTLLGLLASAVLSTAWNWENLKSLKGTLDSLFQVIVFWYCYRVVANPAQERFAWFVGMGTVFGLAYGAYRTAEGGTLSLPLLGTAPRSGIYFGIALLVTIGLAVYGRNTYLRTRVLASLCALACVAGLWLAASRAAILAVAVVFLVLLVKFRAQKVLAGFIAAAALTGYATFAMPDYFAQNRMIDKFYSLLVARKLPEADKERLILWTAALEQIRSGDNIALGVGLRRATVALKAPSAGFDHAHNLFLFKLLEQGVVGLLTFGAFLTVVGVRLLRSPARAHWLSVAALGALLVPVLSGLVGSPWVKEHAILAMIVLGLWAGSERQAAANSG